jgi:F-box/WD-40 domain protein MET30
VFCAQSSEALLFHHRPTLMASIPIDSMALRESIEVPDDRHTVRSWRHTVSIETPPEQRMELEEHARPTEAGEPPSQDNCDGKHDGSDPTISISSTSKLAGQTVAPFLARHIPEQYAPLGIQPQPKSSTKKDPNTKYSYRHRPDSKCRRTADEPTMENLQRVCSTIPYQREHV